MVAMICNISIQKCKSKTYTEHNTVQSDQTTKTFIKMKFFLFRFKRQRLADQLQRQSDRLVGGREKEAR